ncbi:hypothetical protein B0H17DRAFT_1211900 [Mycena rosella]|uniref:DUF6534 domain-containing protein n=1 Tax=Mycena rosella TaxID=1033263 RepID=A0AAD7CUB4_MYCRO|nr:hypothetical protein B0H17DRAFT_1211900 [Mycena rosella]
MSAVTLEPGVPLDNTMGSLLIGVIVGAVLYGISLLQCLFYFTRYERDPVYLRVLVAATVILDTIHLCFVSHTVYQNLISNYYDHESLQVMTWSVSLEALATGITAGIVQLFYAYRVWKMSHHNVILTGIILLFILVLKHEVNNCLSTQKCQYPSHLATAAAGTAWVGLAFTAHTYERLLRITPLTITINSLSTGADVIITETLCFMLHQTRPPTLETETIINRLLIVSSRTLVYAAFYFCIGRLYSNSLLASLNARGVIRGRINDIDSKFHVKAFTPSRITREVFVRSAEEDTTGGVFTHELSIHIARETACFEDESYQKYGQPKSNDTSTVVAD